MHTLSVGNYINHHSSGSICTSFRKCSLRKNVDQKCGSVQRMVWRCQRLMCKSILFMSDDVHFIDYAGESSSEQSTRLYSVCFGLSFCRPCAIALKPTTETCRSAGLDADATLGKPCWREEAHVSRALESVWPQDGCCCWLESLFVRTSAFFDTRATDMEQCLAVGRSMLRSLCVASQASASSRLRARLISAKK